MGSLVRLVAAFTLAHSLTLALSVTGVLRLDPAVVEPVIAASIVAAALQNLVVPSWGDRSRLAVAFSFGLFHGLGFAGGLLEAMSGLPPLDLGLSILGFSVGMSSGTRWSWRRWSLSCASAGAWSPPISIGCRSAVGRWRSRSVASTTSAPSSSRGARRWGSSSDEETALLDRAPGVTCDSPLFDSGGLSTRQAEMYRWVGPDGSNILMKWFSYSGNNMSIGGYAEARDPQGAVDYMTGNPSFTALYPFALVTGAFGQGHDDRETMNLGIQSAAKAKTTPDRQVVVSNEEDFFKDFEATYGQSPELKSLSVSFGNEWDTYVASLAEVSARVKRAAERLRSAEALVTLVNLRDAKFKRAASDLAKRDLAFMNLGLYYEHNFINGGPGATGGERVAWQRRLAGEIEAWVDPLLADSARALGGLIPRGSTHPRFYAFNPLGWTRSDVADMAYAGPVPVHVVDVTTGLEVPSQIVTLSGSTHLRILAPDIPSVGYKSFEIRPGTGADFSAEAPTASAVTGLVQNAHYRVTVAPRGAITSLLDKGRGSREFVRAVGGRAVNDLGAGSGTLAVENGGPVSTTLVATSATPLQHQSRITLYRGLPRVDIRNEVTQNPGDNQWTWGYGFNIDSPEIRHEELGAVLLARLKTRGGDYSPQNARYDWLTMNHFADVSGSGQVGITLSNADASFMRAGMSTVTSLDETTPQVSPLLSGRMSGANIPSQAGDSRFLQRFALQAHGAFDPAQALRFSLEHQNPLVTSMITGSTTLTLDRAAAFEEGLQRVPPRVPPSRKGYPAGSFSLAAVSEPAVLLWALKPSEEGIQQGVIARVWNPGAAERPFSVSLSGGVQTARRASHIETDLGPASVSGMSLVASAGARQIQTYRLLRSGSPDVATPADFNADGKTDILWRNRRTGANYVWFMDRRRVGSGMMLPALRSRDWSVGGIADLNRDSRPDIVWCNKATGANAVWYLDGVKLAGRDSLPPLASPDWCVTGTPDLNRDGRPDLLLRNGRTGANQVWFMDGRPPRAVLGGVWTIAHSVLLVRVVRVRVAVPVVVVQDHSDDLLGAQPAQGIVDGRAGRDPRAHDEQEAVEQVLHEDGVGHRQERRRVHEHVVESASGPLGGGHPSGANPGTRAVRAGPARPPARRSLRAGRAEPESGRDRR